MTPSSPRPRTVRDLLAGIVRTAKARLRPSDPAPDTFPSRRTATPPQDAGTATVEIAPPPADGLQIGYAPELDGDPDAGEIVWTWVPYAENDGRGKDRPVLVIARQDASRVFAVKLTSKAHDGDRDFLPIGTGDWDSAGRASWLDLDQVYSVHRDGLRREAAILDEARYRIVADALHRRWGWPIER